MLGTGNPSRRTQPATARPFGPYLAAVVAAGVTLGLVGIILARAALPTALLLYLIPVILAATRWGRGPAIVTVLLSVVGHDLLFVEPVGTLIVSHADEAIGLALLLLVAVVTAELAEAARRGAQKEQEAALAQRSDALKTALLRAVSHDLRTPLASIKAGLSALRQPDTAYTSDDRAELLAAAEEETDRLDRLVRNLLDASRLEAGALAPQPQPQDLRELLGEVVHRLEPLLADRSVEVAIADTLPLVRCDYAQIDHAVSNLLENAVRHTPPHTPISISATLAGARVQIAIADHGPGVPASDRERVFQPFERGRTLGDGTGLGLAIARGLIEANGGQLRLEDVPGGGACFAFSLPVADGAA